MRPRPARFAAALCCGAASLAAGCGYDGYERDFAENTLPYFELRRELDGALSAPWERSGISLRVPQGYRFVSPPPEPTKEELEDEYYQPPADPRQPEYLVDDLPGLKAAWQLPAPQAGTVGQRWLYVLDSAGLENDPVRPGLPAEELVFEVADRFARTFNLNTPRAEEYRRENFPSPPRPFAPQVAYEAPGEPLTGDVDGVEHRVELFVHREGGRVTVLALVVPTEALMNDRSLGNDRDLMLQTLEVSRSSRSSAPAQAPPGGGGAAF